MGVLNNSKSEKNHSSHIPYQYPQLCAINYNFRMLSFYIYCSFFLCFVPMFFTFLSDQRTCRWAMARMVIPWFYDAYEKKINIVVHSCKVCANFRHEWAFMSGLTLQHLKCLSLSFSVVCAPEHVLC